MPQFNIPAPIAKPNLLTKATIEDGRFNEIISRWFNSVWVAFRDSALTVAVTQANFPDLTNVRNTTLIYVSDYAHFIFWNGVTAVFAGDNPGQLVEFLVPPTGPGWHLCDGAVGVPYLNADGTTSLIDLPVTANTYFRQ